MTDSSTKPELRKTFLKWRQSIETEVWQAKSQQLCQHLQRLPVFRDAKTVLAYFSVRQEPDLSSLFELPKTWGFPRCVETELTWHQWNPLNALPLKKGAFDILEPHPDSPIISANQIDLILVPALACDRSGYRLGYGGGFYDRLLSLPNWATIPTIGIIFDFAYVTNLPQDPWDQPLHFVSTESGIWDCPRKLEKPLLRSVMD